ncbi:sigma-70 family RNA polymerase sigma factor [Kutzneria buriramensis]|uniref:sigma-70 family RNA polymerase sigma factor n=1 Tax=Kutzneria buriramensis TaxID=1045776 RepID=UPI001FEC167D|nr:sigma-70 family RNA polymerase sigma factor [Kutzneria buriramensis]
MPGPSDTELIESVRAGDTAAYGSLYERHVGAAYNLARQLTRSTAEADDLVAEAFAKVLDTLRDGRGPDSAFRAYLLTALRHTAYDKTRRDRKLELAEDVTTVASPEAISVQFSDTAVSGLERSLAAKAFARLPERWQAVLWHTEIEGMSPADVAPILGLTANGVSALAYRAREGLRQAYLQVHLAESTADRCRATVDRLGAWTRGGLSKRETAQVETHLDECERCRALAAELADVNGALRAIVAPLVLGIGTAGYLATIGATTAKAATVVAAGTAGGAAAGAAGAASSVPRQMIGVGASAAALAAVVVLALTSGQSKPIVANAAPPPPPPATTAPPVVPPPTHSPTQPPPPPPPPTTTTTVPSSPATQAPPPPPPTTTTPTPKADLVPSVPGQPISLVPGGPAQELPVTVTNNGNGPSDPVTAKLNLPNGVTATQGGTQSFAARALLANQTISCTGGTGTISCTTGVGLAPGESVTFRFELVAGFDATGGQITGTVMADGGMAIQLGSVDVQVQQLDDLDLTATVWQHDFWLPRVDVAVTNLSTHDGVATVTANAPRDGWLFTLAPCHQDGEQINCKFDLARGQTTRFSVWVFRWHHRGDSVEIAASLGTAHKVIDVPVDCDPAGGEPPLPLPAVPVTPPSSALPTIPSTTTPGSTTKPTVPPAKTTPPTSTTMQPPSKTTTPAPPPTTTTTTPPPTTTTTDSTTPPPPRSDPGLCLPLLNPRWPYC